MNSNWKNKKVTKEEIKSALKTSESLINKRLSTGYECESVDYRGSHPKNKEFRRYMGLDEDGILELALTAKYIDFCHKEHNSKGTEDLYCFKLNVYLEEDITEEVLYKFLIRTRKSGEQVFVMSFHFPDKTKESWEYLWTEE